MPALDDFAPLGHPKHPVVCKELEVSQRTGLPMFEYPTELSDGSKPASYREYEMWMLGRKYTHALHEGTLVDEEAMIEAKAQADKVRMRLHGYRRDRCWHADNQRAFLEVLAGGGSVIEGCQMLGLSKQSVYRHRARDERFRLGWEAALLLGRPRILEEFVERARDGQVETWHRVGPDGGSTLVTRKRYDNVHAIRILDHIAKAAAQPSAENDRVRAVAEDFDTWLASIKTIVEFEPEDNAPKDAPAPVTPADDPVEVSVAEEGSPVDDRLTVASQPDAAKPVGPAGQGHRPVRKPVRGGKRRGGAAGAKRTGVRAGPTLLAPGVERLGRSLVTKCEHGIQRMGNDDGERQG